MASSRFRVFCYLLPLSACIAMVGISHAAPVWTVTGEANTGSVDVSLEVKLPLLGWQEVPISVPPIAQAVQPPTGGSDEEGLPEVDVPLGTLDILSAEGLRNSAESATTSSSGAGVADASVNEVVLLDGLILVRNLVAFAEVSGSRANNGTHTFSQEGKTYAQEILINGSPTLSGEIPPNTEVPLLSTLPITISVLGIPISLQLPFSGNVIVNEQIHDGDFGLIVNGLRVKGAGELPNLARLSVDVLVAGPSEEPNPGLPNFQYLLTEKPAAEKQQLCDTNKNFCQTTCGGPAKVTENFCSATTQGWGCGCIDKVPDLVGYQWPINQEHCTGSGAACQTSCQGLPANQQAQCVQTCAEVYTQTCGTSEQPPAYYAVPEPGQSPKYVGMQ